MSRFALMVVIAGGVLASRAAADGLIHRLPPDGSWVLYRLEQSSEHSMEVPPDVELAERARAGMPKTGFGVGFLSLRSVGADVVEGAPCRWIELEMSVQLAGQSVGGAEAERGERRIVMKILVPEARLGAGHDPFAHVVRMHFKDGQRAAETIDDPQRRQYELDRFRPLFPAPVKDVKRGARGKLRGAPPLYAAREYETQIFVSRYDGPLAGGRGRWTYGGEHRLWLGDDVPFGVAGLEFTSESRETTGADGRITVITRGTRTLTVVAHGGGAASRLPEHR